MLLERQNKGWRVGVADSVCSAAAEPVALVSSCEPDVVVAAVRASSDGECFAVNGEGCRQCGWLLVIVAHALNCCICRERLATGFRYLVVVTLSRAGAAALVSEPF